LTSTSGWTRQIAAAFEQACRDELEAPKPGNVHVFADGHRMTAADFVRSAKAAAGPLATPGARVGLRIQSAVEATFAAVGTNTNVGIILLCAPLAAAAEAQPDDLRASVTSVLQGLDREDAAFAFRAIAHASPAGLGRSDRHDVFAPATATLHEAMAEAADRDCIARQYVTGFADIFDLGAPLLASELAAQREQRLATLGVYLGFLVAFPDTHIVRKHGAATAEEIRHEAVDMQARVRAAHHLEEVLPDILAWDRVLKRDAVNPGTSADLTVATLFAHRLRSILPPTRNSA
jgi:triphosphoribosyl-dephospho-CoA synthase